MIVVKIIITIPLRLSSKKKKLFILMCRIQYTHIIGNKFDSHYTTTIQTR